MNARRKEDICITSGCRKPKAPGRRECHSCRKRNYAKRNPLRYAYNNLKQNAKRRGKEFDLTFDQFRKWAIRTDYIVAKGRSSESYTIDRIDNTKGYTVDNIQILSNADNVRKRMTLQYDYNPETRSMEFYSNHYLPQQDHSDVPF